MAKNERGQSGSGYVRDRVNIGAAGNSGDVVLVGEMIVYLQTDTDDGNIATCEIKACMKIVDVAVTGADGSGNSAVAIGDALYKDGAAINKDATNGVFVGYALAVVASGATATINVAY